MNLQNGQLLRTGNFIDGQWCAADDRSTLRVTDPATGVSLSKVLKCGIEDYLEIKYLCFDING
jgi:hypothetical protein